VLFTRDHEDDLDRFRKTFYWFPEAVEAVYWPHTPEVEDL
jgi:hypothetical protein